MILCPNCNKPFEIKPGDLFFCKDHGWHTKNEAGEIIPANEPSAELIASWSEAPASFTNEPEKQPDPEPDLIDDIKEQPAPMQIGLTYSDISYYTLLAVAGLTALVILLFALWKSKQQRKADLV